MAINFKNMRNEHDFEEMCRQLVHAENPNAVPVEANPGDEGMDSFEGVIDEQMEHIWQFKHFPHGIGRSQQEQIRKSLKKAIEKHRPKKWTFITSTDPSPDNHRWIRKQQEDFPEVYIAVVPATKVREMLIKHQGIRKQYFSLQDEKIDALMRMVGGVRKSDSLPKAVILQNIRNDVAILNDNSPHVKYTFRMNESGIVIGAEPRTAEANGMTMAKMTFAFPKDDAEAKAALEKYMADMDAGRPAVLPGRFVTIHESVFDELMSEDNRISELHIVPKVPDIHLPIRIRFSHGDDEARIPFVNLRLVRRGKSELEFSNATQKDVPVRVSATFRNTPPGTFSVSLNDVVGMRPSEFIEYERALDIMARDGATIEMESLKTGVKTTSSVNTISREIPQGRLRFYEDLLLIERNLDPKLTLPGDITEDDYASILGICRALRSGRMTKRGTARAVLVPNDREQFDRIVQAEEPVTYVMKDGIESFALFGRVYEFKFEAIMTAPVSILEDDLPDGGVRVGMSGELHVTYGKGRCAGSGGDSEG